MPTINVALIGYAFMGKAHSNAFRKIAYMTWPPPLVPRLVMIAGRDEQAVAEAGRRYGYERWTTDWRDLVADEQISLFDNGGPNALHAQPTIAAAEVGKHVICEKPLGRNADESYEMWQRVAASGVKHMCAFNYRFVPAVRLARQLVESGEIGEVIHFRGRYLQEWGADPRLDTWRFHPGESGSGTLGDTGAHVIDLARFLVGEVATVSGLVRTYIPERDVDDAIAATVEFEGGAIGTIEATRVTLGHKNALQWELNGTMGSIAFELERFNDLKVFRLGERGFESVLVTEPTDPFLKWWWPPGHTIGWEHTFVHEILHFLQAIAEDGEVAPTARPSRTVIARPKCAMQSHVQHEAGGGRKSRFAERPCVQLFAKSPGDMCSDSRIGSVFGGNRILCVAGEVPNFRLRRYGVFGDSHGIGHPTDARRHRSGVSTLAQASAWRQKGCS
jgi:predicted dehydrogenase